MIISIEIILIPICVLIAIGICSAVKQRFPDEAKGRHVSLDGLRGFLAILVFLNHANIWYNYSHLGLWNVPARFNYLNLGGVGVSVFFMITGFLFFNKIIISRGKLCWHSFFIARLFRVYPIYIFSGLISVLIIGKLSNFDNIYKNSLENIVKLIIEWLTFGRAYIISDPVTLPGVDASVVMALVTWSLPYEMFFYASLPVLSLIIYRKLRYFPLIIGIIGCYALYRIDTSFSHQIYFVSGGISSLLSSVAVFRTWVKTKIANIVALLSFIFALSGTDFVWGVSPVFIFLTIFFTIVSNGATLFGILTARSSIILGHISYSIYLIHGVVLYCFFHFIIGLDQSKFMTPTEHWIGMAIVTFFVIFASLLTFSFIETPFINIGRIVANKNTNDKSIG